MTRRYAELKPDALDATFAEKPLAILPWGALEWHGPHLPLGLDGQVAEWFAERLAEATSGVLLPTCWMPITTLPHPASLQIRTEAFRMMLDDTIGGLYGAGARMVCVVTGHYAQGHELELYAAAIRAMDSYQGLKVLAATPLEVLGDDALLDHAGRWEAAQLLNVRPDLVDCAVLPERLDPKQVAVLGEDPRKGVAAEGAAILERALQTWKEWIGELLPARDTQFLRDFYAGRRKAYEPYANTYYRTSWEQAILDWWLTR